MEKKDALLETIAAQLQSLMDQADLTVEGLAEAAGLSTHTISKILKKQTRISSKSVDKLTDLFGISASALMSPAKIELNRHPYPDALADFRHSYEANSNYFRSRAKENVVAHFIKSVLVNDPYLEEGRRVKEIARYIRTHPAYQKEFNPKVIAKVLDRMAKAGTIEKEDKTGRGSVFYYRRNPISR